MPNKSLLAMKEFPKSLSITAWAEEDRPREKLLNKGRNILTDAELLGILIRAGTRSLSAVDLAKHILDSVGNDLENLARLSVKDLEKFKGMGEAKAIAIVAALEIGKRRKIRISLNKVKITASEHVYDLMKPDLLDLEREEFWIILLNRANKVLRKENISRGGVTGTVADPKIIFKSALEYLACGIILVHNHPSGNLKPSASDISLTKKLKDGGKHLEINVLDHIIFGDNGYFSFADEGIL